MGVMLIFIPLLPVMLVTIFYTFIYFSVRCLTTFYHAWKETELEATEGGQEMDMAEAIHASKMQFFSSLAALATGVSYLFFVCLPVFLIVVGEVIGRSPRLLYIEEVIQSLAFFSRFEFTRHQTTTMSI